MVRISVLGDCLKSINNAESRGKRQVRTGFNLGVAVAKRDHFFSLGL